MDLSNELSCEAGRVARSLNPHGCFSARGLRLYFPALEPWAVRSVWLLSCSSRFICMKMWDHQVRQPPPHPESSLSSCSPPPLLPVWIYVSSLAPWLLDFHTVRFSVSSGCFLFLNWCPSFGCARRHSVSTCASILAGNKSHNTVLLAPLLLRKACQSHVSSNGHC